MPAFRFLTWKSLSYLLAQACQLASCVHKAEKKCAAVGKYHTMHLHGNIKLASRPLQDLFGLHSTTLEDLVTIGVGTVREVTQSQRGRTPYL